MKLRALVLALLLAAMLAPVALADGDPASDVLITDQLFYPYYSNTPKAGVEKLKQTVADANKQGFTIRVAVITSPYDLGSVSALWEKPQPYARFLSLELGFVYKDRLLIVSPKGYGYVEATKPVPEKLALLKTIPIEKATDGLLATADKAVRLLASRSGEKLPATSGGGGSGSSMDTIVIAIAAAVGAALVAGVELLRRRRRRTAVT
jgi:MYXO-CTERM domain-containing protein